MNCPPEVEPPARVWVSLQAQLELEGIIKDAHSSCLTVSARPVWHGFSDLFRGRASGNGNCGPAHRRFRRSCCCGKPPDASLGD